MVLASTVSPGRRAELRRLRAEFEAAYDAMGEDRKPSTPAFRAADARYRAWVEALDAVALALLDDIDVFEASAEPGHGSAAAGTPRPAPAGAELEPADIDRLFAGLDDLARSVDLIGAAPGGRFEPAAPDATSARGRARSVVGHDRAARQWSLSPWAKGRGGEARGVGSPAGP